MGWWGCGVMEGDPPQDALCEIEAKILGDCIGVLDTEEEMAVAQKRFYDALKDPVNVATLVENIPDGIYEEYEYVQTLGFIVMHAGGTLSPIKQRVLDAISADEWAMEDDERNTEMKKFRRAVREFKDGRVRRVRQRSLFQAIGEHIAAGKTGLVNK